MICPNCGVEYTATQKFCAGCGASLEQIEQSVSTRADAAVEAAPAPDVLSDELARETAAIQQFWPDWTLVEKLGEGSFGKVYKASREEMGTPYYSAIKIIRIPQSPAEVSSARSEIGLDEASTTAYFKGFVDECVNEIKLMESLKGTQNIVSVEDHKVIPHTDEIGWTIYIRMELLTSFTDHTRDRNLSEDEVIKLGIDICSALEMCSKVNVMHRDIKPENIFVSSFGIFKLGDFGIARKLEKATAGMSKKGTYNYMAPEIYNGSTNYDFKSDIYSLGIVLYKLLNNNRLPLLDSHAQTVTYQDLQAAFEKRMKGEALPAPCNAGNAMASVILAACAYDPSQRFASATALKNILLNIQKGAVKMDRTVGVGGAAPAPKPPVSDATVSIRDRKPPEAPKPAPKEDKKAAEKAAREQAKAAEKAAKEQEKEAKRKALEEKKANKKKMPTWKKVMIILLALVIVGAGTFGALYLRWYTSTEQQILRAMDAGNYEAAQELLKSDVEARNSQSLADELIERLNNLQQDFLDKNVEYAAARTEISNISAMEITGVKQTLNDVQAYIDELNQSRTCYATAESFFAATNYAEAIEQYEMVIESDPDYETAMARMAEAVNNYRDQKLTNAAAHAEKGSYAEAISLLEEALTVLPNDAKISEQITLYQSDLKSKTKSDTLASAKTYADAEDYANAIRTVSALLSSNSSDADLTAAYNDYTAKYQTQVIAAVDALVAQKKYDEAITQVNTALNLLPDNQAFKDKLANLEAAKPVSLSTMTPINGGWTWNEGSPKDPFGNDYSTATNFAIINGSSYSTREYYAEYRLYGKYSTLTGTLAPYTSIGTNSVWYIQVYADDVLVYTSPEVGRKTDAFTFAAPITGADYVKVKVMLGEGADSILSNMMVEP